MRFKINNKITTNVNLLQWWWCSCNNNNNNNKKYMNNYSSLIYNNNNINNKRLLTPTTIILSRFLPSSRSSSVVQIVTLILLVAALLQPVQGGTCWTMVARTGRCMELLTERVSRESCCGAPGAAVSTAWSQDDMDPGTLFFWRALGGGVPCTPCRESCSEVECGPGKKCLLRNGRPRCVCEPECRKGRHQRGPVCGTDGRSYRNVCRLRKRACRRHSNLAVAYQGHCQSSCEKIHCPDSKQCLLDQNLTPHCVKCSRKCPSSPPMLGGKGGTKGARKYVCGTDGATYPSACHLREAACRKGKAIPLAYKGRCKPFASCSNVRCRERQMCLVDINTGHPRCVTCGMRCGGSPGARGGKDGSGGPICGTNNLTYQSWCHMTQDACATGYVIDTKHPGNCTISAGSASSVAVLHPAESNSAVSNTVFVSEGGDSRYS